MPAKLTTPAPERGTYAIDISGAQSPIAGESITLENIRWTLSDAAGTVINDRTRQEIEAPSSGSLIVLYGDDLALSEAETGRYVRRILLIEAVFDHDGVSLPYKQEYWFQIENFVKVEPVSSSGNVTLGGADVTLGGEDVTIGGN